MDTSNYFEWLEKGTWIRITARAIIFNQAEDHILIEENLSPENIFFNFIGGGVEVGESLQSCITNVI
ncbi:MAG: hypothetical protein AAF633_16730 [Chloroflexota bacterium]